MQRLDAVIVIHCNDIEKLKFEYIHAYPDHFYGTKDAEHEFEHTIRKHAPQITDDELEECFKNGCYAYENGFVVIHNYARWTEG